MNVNDFTILAGRFGPALAPDNSLQRGRESLGTTLPPFGGSPIVGTKSDDDALIGVLV